MAQNNWTSDFAVARLQNNHDRMCRLARQTGRAVNPRSAAVILIDALKNVDDLGVKNAAAIALSDLGADAAVPVLIEFIQSRKYSRHRGTFVYALCGLDWRRYVDEVIPLLWASSYEVQQAAALAVAQLAPTLTARERQRIHQMLSSRLYHKRVPPVAKESMADAIAALVAQEIPARHALARSA